MDFRKKFLTFFSGTILAQLITVGMSPILTRLYSAEEFGHYNLYLSFLAIITVISTLRLQFTFNQAEDKREISIIYNLIKYSALIFSLMSLIILMPFSQSFDTSYNIFFLILLTISVYYQSVFYANNYMLNRLDDFRTLSLTKVNKSGINAGFNLLFSFLKMTTYGLLLSNTLSIILANYYQRKELKIKGAYDDFNHKKKHLIKTLKKYRDFPIYNIPSALSDTIALNAPIIIFSSFYGLSIAGQYGLAFRTISMPLSLVGQSVGQVFLNEISKKYRESSPFFSNVVKILVVLALIGIIPLIVIILGAPSIFAVIFGSSWETSGVYTQIIIIGLYFKFIVSPLTNIFFIVNELKILMILQIIRGVTTLGILLYSSYNFDIITTLWIYTIHEILFYLLYLILILIISKRSSKNLLVR